MRRIVLATLAVALALATAEADEPPTTAGVLSAAQPSDWRELDQSRALYLFLDAGVVVFELAPQFAPRHIENIRRLVADRYFDGLAILRSQDNYVVQWGDTLRKIADRFDLSLQDLIAANPQIRNPNVIYRGQVVYMPGTGSLYTVQRGDTMKKIAANYGTSLQSLISLNPQIWNVNLIYPGQVIRLW